jgi:hypothetical protein
LPSFEEAAGGFLGACIAAKPPSDSDDICGYCFGPKKADYPRCWDCHLLWVSLGRTALRPVVPISLCADETQVYEALKQYKGGRVVVSRAQRMRLAGLIGLFLEKHGTCISPDGWDLVTTVPSLSGREGTHPLVATIERIQSMGPVLDGMVLEKGPGKVARNKGARDAFVCRRPEAVRERRVLLLEDLYVTGSHVQSAVAALSDAGAQAVYPVVVGRRLNRGWSGNDPMFEWAAREENRWSPERCVRCWNSE